MTSNEIDVYRSASIDQRIRYATLIADARGLLPEGVHSPAHALLIFEQAAALEIPPIIGLSQIHIIKGKPTLSAGLMSGKIRQAGHKLRIWVEGKVEDDSLVAKAELIRSDDPDFTFKVEFSLKDARRAGLFPGKADSNWQKWPRAMVKSRVTSEIAREGATDVFLGAIYTPEELNPNLVVDEEGEPVQMTVKSEQMTNLSPETTESSEIKAQPDGMPEEIRRQWFEAATKISGDRAALDAFYQDIKTKGLFDITDPDDPEVRLVEYVVALGKAAKEAEAKEAEEKGGPVEGEVDHATGEVVYVEDEQSDGPPAVLDDAVSPPEAPKKAPARSRARKPANASDGAASQG